MATNFYGLKDQPIITLSEIYSNAASLPYAYNYDGVQIGDYVLVNYNFLDKEKYEDLLKNDLTTDAINIFTETKNQTISNLVIDDNINQDHTIWKKEIDGYKKIISFMGESKYFLYKGIYFTGDFIPVTNLVTNGDFSNGITPWTTLYGDSLSVSNNTLTVASNAVNSTIQARQKTTAIFAVGNKMYFKAKIRVKDSSCLKLYVALFGNAGISRIIGNVNLPSANQWYPISGLYTNTGDSGFINTQVVAQYTDIASANGKIMEIQYATCIDLTATFGAGNEPTVTEMDALLDQFPNKWFDGTTEILPDVSKNIATNLLVNGDFSDGVSSNFVTYTGALSANNNTLIHTANSASAVPVIFDVTDIPIVANTKFFIRAKVSVTNDVCKNIYLALSGSTGGQLSDGGTGRKSLPEANTQYDLYTVLDVGTALTGNLRVRIESLYANAETANGKVMQVKYWSAINLTATFGAGNEPTATEMDTMLSIFPNSWFNGGVYLPEQIAIDNLSKGNYLYAPVDDDFYDLLFCADNNGVNAWEWRKNNLNALIIHDEESGLKSTYSSKYIAQLLPDTIVSNLHTLDVDYYADSLDQNQDYQDNYLKIGLDANYDPNLTYYYLSSDGIYYEYQYFENSWNVDLKVGLYIKYKDIHLVGNHFVYNYSHNHGWISNQGKFLDRLPSEEGTNLEVEKDLSYFLTKDIEFNNLKDYFYMDKFDEFIQLVPTMSNVLLSKSYSSSEKYYFEINNHLKDIIDFYDKTCIDIFNDNPYINYTNNLAINEKLALLANKIKQKNGLIKLEEDVSSINQTIFIDLLEVYLILFLELKENYESSNSYGLNQLNYNLLISFRRNFINIQESYSLDELFNQINLLKKDIVNLDSIYYGLYSPNNWAEDKIYLKTFNWNNYTLYEKDLNQQYLVYMNEDSRIHYIDFEEINGIRQKIICQDCGAAYDSTSINLYSSLNNYSYTDGSIVFVKFLNGLSSTTTITLNLEIVDFKGNKTNISGKIKYNGKDGSSIEYDNFFLPTGRTAMFLIDKNELNDAISFYLLNPYYKLPHTHMSANIDKVEYGTWTPYFNKIIESSLKYEDALTHLINKNVIVETENWKTTGKYYQIDPARVNKIIKDLGSNKKLSNSINYSNISNSFTASDFNKLTIGTQEFVTRAGQAIAFLESKNILSKSDNWFNYFSNLGYPQYQAFFWLVIKAAIHTSNIESNNVIERSNCSYSRIGNIVNLFFDIELRTSVLNDLEIELRGLPYNPASPAGSSGVIENVAARTDSLRSYCQTLYLDPSISTWQESIQALSSKKIIDNPNYWISILKEDTELSMNLRVFIVILGNFDYNSNNQRSISSVKNAIKFLDRKNAMINTEYWYNNYSKVSYLDKFLLSCANRLNSEGALLTSHLEVRTSTISSDGTINMSKAKYLRGASQNSRIYGSITYMTNQSDFIKNKSEPIDGIYTNLMQVAKTETQIDNSSVDYLNLLSKKEELQQAYKKLSNRLAVLNAAKNYEIEE